MLDGARVDFDHDRHQATGSALPRVSAQRIVLASFALAEEVLPAAWLHHH